MIVQCQSIKCIWLLADLHDSLHASLMGGALFLVFVRVDIENSKMSGW